MLILVPFVLIVLIILAIDAIYFGDINIEEQQQRAPIIKEDNRSKSMKNYFEKYIEK